MAFFSMISIAHHLLFVKWHKKLSGVKFVYLFGKVIALTSRGEGSPNGVARMTACAGQDMTDSRFLVFAHVSVHTSVCCVPLHLLPSTFVDLLYSSP